MNILLVYPEMPNSIVNFLQISKLTGKKGSFPPIGLLTVAALLPSEWNKKVVDLNTDSLTLEDLKWANYVFISAMNVQALKAKELIQLCNENNVKVVAGGPLFTHEYVNFEGVSHFVLNEAEITLPLFLKDLETGNPKHIYKTSEFANVHQTPAPMWELIDLNKYLNSIVQYSRGCPYLCDFCDVTALFGRIPRTKTSEQVINELDTLVTYSNETIFFADDNLIGNKKQLKADLLPALIEWRSRNQYAPAFFTQLTMTLADDKELCYLLLEAGFRHILIGIESIDEKSLIAMRKKHNAGRNILETIKFLQGIGFIVVGTFIVGLDTDKSTVFDDVINFVQESGIVYAMVFILKAPPGTELYERMKRENRLLSKFEFGEDKTNIIPILDVNVLHEGYKKVMGAIYSPANVLERIKQYYKDKSMVYKAKYPIRRRVTLKEIIKALNLIFRLGILQKERNYFWKIVWYTFRYNYHYMDHAMFNAALMYQYRCLWEAFLQKEKNGVLIYSTKMPVKLMPVPEDVG